MCDPKILQEAIESYLKDEENLFGGLNTKGESWYKESVEDNASATNQSTVEPTMNTKQEQTKTETETKSETKTESTINKESSTMGDKMNTAKEATVGFFKKHAGFVGFVLGVVTCAGAQAGYQAYKDKQETATGGSEQAS